MGGRSVGSQLWLAGVAVGVFAVVGCRYEANPRGGEVRCAANGMKRCPDGYACHWASSDSSGCIETCWPTTKPAPPQCGMDASQGSDEATPDAGGSGPDLQGSGGAGAAPVATGG